MLGWFVVTETTMATAIAAASIVPVT